MALELQSGLVVGQRYRLVRLLGEGGMGLVWAATHMVTRKSVALKFLKGADAMRADVRRRFVREARAATAARHPNVVEIHDIFELEDGSPVMVMDLLVGQSLGALRHQRRVMTPEELAPLMVPVISAVGTAHSMGIVHRDLKPDNIFVVSLPDGKHDVRVLDFGIAKLTASEGVAAHTGGLTQAGDMLGTPHYMAPEQASGEADIDHRADIWALGVILYECLAGHRPVQGNNLGQILKQIITGNIVPFSDAAPGAPADLKQLVDSMLAHDRANRPSDLRPVQEVLARYTDVQVPSFAEARPLSSRVNLPPSAEPSDPYGATATPTKNELKRKVEQESDPRWLAATFSVQPEGAASEPPRRRRLILIIGGGVAALISAGVAIQYRAQPTAPIMVVSTMPTPAPTVVVIAATPAPSPAAPLVTTPLPKHREKRAHPLTTTTTKSLEPPGPTVEPPAKRLPGGVPEKAPF